MSVRIHRTACPRNCYSTCSFKVWIEDNQVLKLEPEPLNRATPEGVCLKGLSYVERSHSPERIIQPLKRKRGQFVPISWDEALEEIGERLLDIHARVGPHGVLFYSGSGSSGLMNDVSRKFWTLYGGATTVYGNLCWPAGLEAIRLTLGEVKHNVAWDIAHAGLILLWGKNPAETNIHQMLPIEQAKANGAKIVVIDPRRTMTAEKADLLLQPKPGTDGLLALCLAKCLILHEKVDEPFIRKHVLGYDAFRETLETISLEETSQVCGISLPMIEKLAKWMADIRPMTLVPGYGLQRFTNGGQTIRCLLALSVITGQIGKPGACFHYADLQGDVFSRLKEPQSYYPDPARDGLFRRCVATARLGEEMDKLKDPPLLMAWVERGNPVSQNPDSRRIREAFRKLEFRVVVDEFLTDTAQEADIILPAKNLFEQSDIISSYWNPYIQYKPKVLDPPPGVRPESEIYDHLARQMGFQEEEIRYFIPAPGDRSTEFWLKKQVEQIPGLSWDSLMEGPVLAPGLQEIAFEDFRFPTPSGKIELWSEDAAKIWGTSPLPVYVAPLNGKPEYPFQLMSPNTKNRIHSQFGNLESIRAVAEPPHAAISARDAHSKGILTGQSIRVFNETGEVRLPAKIDGSLRPGLVVICNGYWHQEGACPNNLTTGRETDMGHGTAFHDTWVNIEKS